MKLISCLCCTGPLAMGFTYPRTIRFHETDGAGVVFFAHGLTLCHEAYEASLAAAGVPLPDFFAARTLAYPIVHATIDFRRPLTCGDAVMISLTPAATSPAGYEVTYRIELATEPRPVATACTRHVCIQVSDRSRHPLPPPLQHWLHHWAAVPG